MRKDILKIICDDHFVWKVALCYIAFLNLKQGRIRLFCEWCLLFRCCSNPLAWLLSCSPQLWKPLLFGCHGQLGLQSPTLHKLGGVPPLQDSLNCGAESAEVEGMVIGFCRVFSVLNPVSLDSLGWVVQENCPKCMAYSFCCWYRFSLFLFIC